MYVRNQGIFFLQGFRLQNNGRTARHCNTAEWNAGVPMRRLRHDVNDDSRHTLQNPRESPVRHCRDNGDEVQCGVPHIVLDNGV